MTNDISFNSERNLILKHFRSLTDAINRCDVGRALLISNIIGEEQMTLEDARRLRNLATKFSERCIYVPKIEYENL